ncbi:TerD family protein [Actimicrobium sp. CCI2.3]|uniref:TerD family protein n=1 Tax=Actimicrobium sp. CCI2.3 TaxID=3048616 RepID=UPI002AB39D04|nr:TerD family protein [Actimicrobium sp. CCI2.3]MDY7575101.1 TerD family protein [Actimicrobium sp. CCI2.3]MEB0022558.1 TerD family protein [Actimicrobium sp. CCI2.3]
MAISLQKGGNVNLTKGDPNLKQVLVGLGWSARSSDGAAFDLDASLFMVQENGKVRGDHDFIFYNQLRSLCGSVEHSGDNQTGEGDGDDEALKVLLDSVPPEITRLVVAVTIHDADLRKQNFGMVEDAYIRIVNLETRAEIVRFDLSEDYSTQTAMVFAEVYRHQGEWKFKAVGQGYAGGLEAVAKQLGVQIA